MTMRTAVVWILLGWSAAAAAEQAAAATGVAIGSLGGQSLPASTQYVLRSTVFEQLRSRGVPTMEVSDAPYVYLARVGLQTVEKGCVYRVTVDLVPNTTGPSADRPSLWSREFSSSAIDCSEASGEMTKTLDRFAVEFARDSASGQLRSGAPAAARK